MTAGSDWGDAPAVSACHPTRGIYPGNGPHDREQYHLADDSRRRAVRPRYELLYHGLYGDGPLSCVAGGVATQLGAPQTVRIGDIGCLIGALVFARHAPALREMVRPIYTSRGLIQGATLQTQTAVESCLHGHH